MEINSKSNRREFIKTFGMVAGASMLASGMPWLNTVMASDSGRTVKLGLIGPGSRGTLHLLHLMDIPGVELSCFCDNYEPHFQRTQAYLPNAKGYVNYKEMLEKEQMDGVVIATPLFEHARMVIDAFEAGLHVFCEKSLAMNYEECNNMVNAWEKAQKNFTIGHQRMFSIRYQQAYKLIKEGKIGKPTQIRAYWHRNNDWRRKVPRPELERKINWRLYHEYSLGLMTELCSHQVQVANQILGENPAEVWGAGSINYWKDGREVYDNVNLVYKYPGGTHFLYDSMTSNKKYGFEEQVMGPKGTMELEAGKMYEEFPPPAPAILQLINDLEHEFFEAVPIGGASWVPDDPVSRKGEYILDEVMDDDGTRMMLEVFVANVRDNRIDREQTRQGFYSGISSIMGFEAMMENKIVSWPEGLSL
jgi:predicted dehydrogenase